MYDGSWQGDRIVANSDQGLVVLNTRGGLHVESLFATPAFPHGINEPVFVDDTHVQGWADVGKPKTTAGGPRRARVRQRRSSTAISRPNHVP